MEEIKDDLKNHVLQLIEQKGQIDFAEFMDIALYYPELGYYQKQNPFGIQGSFYTSVDASESFGKSIGNAVVNLCTSMNLSKNICEMGAGSGMLCNDVLNRIKDFEPEFYEQVSYTIIEKSEYLIKNQQELLKNHAGKVRWITFEELNNFDGVFFSNELVDAFPVHRVIRMPDGLKEIFVRYIDGKFQYFPDEIKNPELMEYLDRIKLRVTENQIVDLNLDMVHWMKALSSKINKGAVITIDYGYPAAQIFSSHRRDGTVTCYYKHQQNNDFFDRIGYQDITAFVDFTTLEIIGKESGLNNIKLMPQWLFLVRSGILDEIKKAETDIQKSSIKALIMPEGGFGTNFHVLMQTKGAELPENSPYNQSPADTFAKLAEVFTDEIK